MWNITNQQQDPMTFTLDDGTIVNAPAHVREPAQRYRLEEKTC